MASLSRQLARWVVSLRYEDLPPAVVDRAKGLTLHGLASVLLGSQTSAGQQAVTLITDEEAGVPRGASIMVESYTIEMWEASTTNFSACRAVMPSAIFNVIGSVQASVGAAVATPGVFAPDCCSGNAAVAMRPPMKMTSGHDGQRADDTGAGHGSLLDEQRDPLPQVRALEEQRWRESG